MATKSAGMCSYCGGAISGGGGFHPACKKKAESTSNEKIADIPLVHEDVATRTYKRLAIDPTQEHKAIREKQMAHDQAVDSKYRVDLQTKLYEKDTPEFNEIAAIYLRREKSNLCGATTRKLLQGVVEREKSAVSGIRASLGSLQRMR